MNELLDSRQLKAFVKLAKTGSYTETAKQLCLTHSAISHSMRALEAQVGCLLLSKVKKKVVLTEAGEALLHHATRALEEMRRARSTLVGLNRWGSRRLRLAVHPIFLPAFLAPVLLQFHAEFPRVSLQVESCGSAEPGSLLESNRADVVLAEKPATDEAVGFEPVLADRFQLVVNSGHPLAAKKSTARDDLGKYPCLLLRQTIPERSRLENFLAQGKINLNLIGEIESVEAVKEFVKRSPAVSFLPGWVVGQELNCGSFSAVGLGRTPFETTWGFAYSSGRPLNHLESTLLKLCRKQAAEFS